MFSSRNRKGIDEIRSIAARSGANLVYIDVGLDLDGHGAALIVRPDGDGSSCIVALPDLTDRTLRELLAPRYIDLEEAKRSLGAGPDDAIGLGYATSYLSTLVDGLSPKERATADEVWRRRLVTMLTWLDKAIMAPLVRQLPAGKPLDLILFPDGRLAGLPMHACASVIDRQVRVAYAPSASLLDRLLDRTLAQQPSASSTKALLVADPNDAEGFGAIEAREIATIFVRAGGRARLGKDLSWLRRVAEEGDEIAICAHAAFEPIDAYRSMIHLGAGSQGLTLAALYGGAVRLKQGASVLLSSCETARVDTRLAADEHLGFPAGFFLAGARFVVSSLWSMSALAAFTFSVEYYRHRLSGQARSSSTFQAARTVREMTREALISRLLDARRRAYRRADLRSALQDAIDQVADGPEFPFSHPVHWACFAGNGL